jgi:hypothetical protein
MKRKLRTGAGRGFVFRFPFSVLSHPYSALCRPGDDLLSHVLRQSTIGAEAFDGRVRDGIGSYRLARATRPAKGGMKQNWVFDFGDGDAVVSRTLGSASAKRARADARFLLKALLASST